MFRRAFYSLILSLSSSLLSAVCACVMFIFWIYVCIALFNPVSVCNECMDVDDDDDDGDTHHTEWYGTQRSSKAIYVKHYVNTCMRVCARIVNV